MFARILDHPLIDVRTGTEFDDVRDEVEYDHLVYTGPVDAFFGHRFGKLPYRSLEFEIRSEPTPDGGLKLPATVVNHPSADVPWTRVTEYRRMTGQLVHDWTTMHAEHPRSEGDPYYPIPTDENRALYKRYEALAAGLDDVTFVGRLARYQYLNMDQVVGQALKAFDDIAARAETAAA
jgi:UDP-galactopyranose mutase